MSREEDVRAYEQSPARRTAHYRPDGLTIWLAALAWERGRGQPPPPREPVPEDWTVTSLGKRFCNHCGMLDYEGHGRGCPTQPEAP